MNPDISEIIKVCLKIVKYIMFYVPRTLMLEELFGIISEIKGSKRLFFDIHILKSANKIKALLIIFGCDIDKKIKEKEIDEYLEYIYENFHLNEIYIKIFSAIAKIIGNYRFFENEINFRRNLYEEYNSFDENFNIGKELFNYFFKLVLTDQEKIKVKSLKIYSQFKLMNNKSKKNNNNNINKNKDKFKNEEEKNAINNNININAINSGIEKNYNFIDKYTITYTGDNNEIYIKMKNIDKNMEEEKVKVQKYKYSKLSPKVKKKMNLKELFDNDKKIILSNSSTPTVSSSPSSIITSNNRNSEISISEKKDKNQSDWNLILCKEISLCFIKI